jgi:hypothetical protein
VGDVETLLVKYEQVFNPRLFVVKAYQLKRLIMRCQLFTVERATAGQLGEDQQALSEPDGDTKQQEDVDEVKQQLLRASSTHQP